MKNIGFMSSSRDVLIGIIFIVVFVIATILNLFGLLQSYQQFVAVLLSAAATYVIVVITISRQSSQQESRDKNIRIYQKKLEVYSKFNALLWSVDDKSDFDKVKDMCMQELIFVISENKIQKLTEALKSIKDNFENEDKVKESYSIITAILRADLKGEDNNSVEKGHDKILKVFNAINHNEDNETQGAEENSVHVESKYELKCPEIRQIWNDYEASNIQCWHFNAFDVNIQNDALKGGNGFLSLIEYGEDWRTERLKQVRSGDVVFLFNRGGSGYVGLYRATDTIVLRMDNGNIYMSLDGGEEKIISLEEANQYDIYYAIGDGATLVSDIKVEAIMTRDHSWNPIGTMRQTIVRPNADNVWELLKYFDSDDN